MIARWVGAFTDKVRLNPSIKECYWAEGLSASPGKSWISRLLLILFLFFALLFFLFFLLVFLVLLIFVFSHDVPPD